VKRLAVLVIVVGACGHDAQSPPPPTASDSSATFVAFPATFQPFRTWTFGRILLAAEDLENSK